MTTRAGSSLPKGTTSRTPREDSPLLGGTTPRTPREELLMAAIDHVAEHGVRDLSLRSLATAIGTSHRMLIYHFGSKHELFVEIVREVEERQRQAFARIVAGLPPDASPTEIARRMWKQVSDPSLAANTRLFFELCSRALQGDELAATMFENTTKETLAVLTDWGVSQGLPRRDARANARLGLAVYRGLLLDLLGTGDRRATGQAVEHFAHLTELLQRSRESRE